ncbi:aspartate/ornithine carbamoyltransferase family protein [Xenorhabdus bovienii]|uniref:aspartate/ornithine carbamoyltransferase family protein n=1 Tax=Xenorhabdus bovienii TaxID=40576 RepID=UPI0020CA3CD0|nr:hypothetical protein [Xenorhabdus bovienii]
MISVQNFFLKDNLLSIKSLDLDTIMNIIDLAQNFKVSKPDKKIKKRNEDILVASLFFQASTRTRLSFESAANRLGARVIGFANGESSRSGSSWNEQFTDTAQMINAYADIAVMRHAEVESVHNYCTKSRLPVINAGNGEGLNAEHPTQALLDIFTIHQSFPLHKSLTLLLCCHPSSRSARSLLFCIALFHNIKLLLCTEENCKLFQEDEAYLRQAGVTYEYLHNIKEGLCSADVIYMAGYKETADHLPDSNLIFTPDLLSYLHPRAIIMHPLPRGYELPYELDDSVHCAYFSQAENGVFVRMAILQGYFNVIRGR